MTPLAMVAAAAATIAAVAWLRAWLAVTGPGRHVRPRRQPPGVTALINTPTQPVPVVPLRPTTDTIDRLRTIAQQVNA